MIDLDLTIDYKSQAFLNKFVTFSLIASSILSFIIGFVSQNIVYSVYSYGFLIVLIALVALPNYPIYNKNKVNFLTVEYVK